MKKEVLPPTPRGLEKLLVFALVTCGLIRVVEGLTRITAALLGP